jgi:hypothetical protein
MKKLKKEEKIQILEIHFCPLKFYSKHIVHDFCCFTYIDIGLCSYIYHSLNNNQIEKPAKYYVQRQKNPPSFKSLGLLPFNKVF